MATVADLEILVTSDTGDAEAGLGRVEEKVNKAAAATALMGVAKVGVDIFSGAIMGAAEFEAAIVDAQIATGMSIPAIEDMVYSLAEAFPVSTTEVANLIEALGKLGVTSGEMEAVSTSVLQLSSALGTDLVGTGEAAVQILNSLGMSMENMDEITNQLFKILAAGTLDLDTFMSAWKNMGSSVKQAGMAFVDAAGFLTVLTDAGINAATAGQTLARLFNELMNPSEELKTMLSELGIQFTDLEGNLLPVKDIILNIMDAWDGLTNAEKMDLAELIGGKEYMNELMTLFDQGREAFNRFMDNYNNAMDLQDAITAKMGTAKAMWDTFMETIQNVQIVVGQKLLPAFKSVLEFLTPLVSGIKNLSPEFLTAAVAIGLLVTAFTGLAAVIGIFQTFGIGAAMMGLMLNPITLLIAGLGLLAAKFLTTGDNMAKVKDYASRLIDAFQMVRGTGVDPVTAALRALGIVFPDLYGHVLTAIGVWEGLQSAFKASVKVLSSVTKAIAEFVKSALEIGAVRDVIAGLAAGFASLLAMKKAISVFNSVKKSIMALRVAVLALNTAFLANPVVLIIAAIIALGVAIYLLYQRFEAVRNVVDPVLNILRQLGSFLMGVLIAGFNAVSSAIGTFIGWIASGVSAVADFLSEMGFFSAMAAAIGSALDSLGSIFDNIISAVKNLGEAFSALMDGDISGFFSNIGEAILDVIQAVATVATTIPRMLWNAFTQIDWSALGSTLVSWLASGIQAAGGALGNLWGWLTDTLWNALSSMPAIINDGIQLAWDAITSLEWEDFISVLEWIDYVIDLAWDTFVEDLLWTSFVTLLSWAEYVANLDWGTYVTTLSWMMFIGILLWSDWVNSLLWSTFVTLLSWVDYVSQLTWADYVSILSWATWLNPLTWSTYVFSLFWGSYVDDLSWDTFIDFLTWASYLTPVTWGTWIVGLLWTTFISDLGWDDYVTALEWATWLNPLTWSTYVFSLFWGSYVDDLSWDDFLDLLAWASYVNPLTWGTWLVSLTWSTFVPDISWSDFIPKMSWPSAGEIKDAIVAEVVGWFKGDSGSGNLENPTPDDRPNWDLSDPDAGDTVPMSFNLSGGGGGFSSLLSGLKQVRDAFTQTTGYVQTQSGLWVPATQQNTAGMPMVAYNAFTPLPVNANSQFGAVPTAASTNLSPVGGIISSTLGAAASIASMALTGLGVTAGVQFAAVPTAASSNLAPVNGIVGSTLGGATLAANAALLGMGLAAAVQFAAVPMAATTNLGTLGGVVGGLVTSAASAASAGFNSLRSSAQSNFAQVPISAAVNFGQMAASVASQTASAAANAASNTARMAAQVGANAATMAANAIRSATQANTSSTAQMLGMQMGATLNSATMRSNVTSNVNGMQAAVNAAATNAANAMRIGMQAASNAVRSAASSWAGLVAAGGGAAAATAGAIGANIGNSLAAGIRSAYGAVAAAAAALVAQADIAMRARAQIASPSKMTTYFGHMIGEGLVGGMKDSMRDVSRQSTRLADAALTQPVGSYGMNARHAAVLTGNTGNTTTVYQTNYYTIDVETMEELSEAVEFVSDLDRQRQLVMTS